MLDMKKVVRLSFEKEEFTTKMLPNDAKAYDKFLRTLLIRIDGLIKRKKRIDEEIASEIVIACMVYMHSELGFDEEASVDQIESLVTNFMASAMLKFNFKEDLR
jgi:hypothetical protein